MKDNLTIFGGCLIAIFLVVLNPVLCFFGGWICGWLLKFFIGDTVANGLNLLLNTAKIYPRVSTHRLWCFGYCWQFFQEQ